MGYVPGVNPMIQGVGDELDEGRYPMEWYLILRMKVESLEDRTVEACNEGVQAEEYKVLLVRETHTSVDEEAVVVTLEYTFITEYTVMSPPRGA